MKPEEVRKENESFMDGLVAASENESVMMLLELVYRCLDSDPYFESYEDYTEHTDDLKISAAHSAYIEVIASRRFGAAK